MPLLLKNTENKKIITGSTSKCNWLFLIIIILFSFAGNAILTYYRKNYKLCLLFSILFFTSLYSLSYLSFNPPSNIPKTTLITIMQTINISSIAINIIFLLMYNKWYFNNLIKNNYRIIYKPENYKIPEKYQQYTLKEETPIEELEQKYKSYIIKRFFITIFFTVILLFATGSINYNNKNKHLNSINNPTEQIKKTTTEPKK